MANLSNFFYLDTNICCKPCTVARRDKEFISIDISRYDDIWIFIMFFSSSSPFPSYPFSLFWTSSPFRSFPLPPIKQNKKILIEILFPHVLHFYNFSIFLPYPTLTLYTFIHRLWGYVDVFSACFPSNKSFLNFFIIVLVLNLIKFFEKLIEWNYCFLWGFNLIFGNEWNEPFWGRGDE